MAVLTRSAEHQQYADNNLTTSHHYNHDYKGELSYEALVSNFVNLMSIQTSSSTSSSSFVRPAIALRSPTVICGNTVSVTSTVDDATFTLALPFPITIYGVANTTVQVSSNGVSTRTRILLPLSLAKPCQILGIGAPITTAYANAALPQYAIDSTGVFPFWDDLFISLGTPQGIFYEVDGTAPSRSVTFEWYTSHYNNETYYAHFLISFWESMPNVTTIDYLNITDSGSGATVGIEAQTRKFDNILNTANCTHPRAVASY